MEPKNTNLIRCLPDLTGPSELGVGNYASTITTSVGLDRCGQQVLVGEEH